MGSKRLRGLDIFIVILFLCGALVSLDMFRRDLLHTFNLQNVEPVGKVVVKKNTVQRRLSDRIVWDRLARESPVYIGDLIRVADISAATLYIQDNSIALEENTLVRITPAPDGEGFQIQLTQGSVAVYSEHGAGKISLNIGGQQINVEPGTVVSAAAEENRMPVIQVSQSIEQFIEERSAAARNVPENAAPVLVSPAVNSNIRFADNSPVTNFQWTEVDEAVSYVVEVSKSPDFSNLRVKRNISTASLSDATLEEGTWFWRVTPVFPPMYAGNAAQSSTGFFSMEKTLPAVFNSSVSMADWLAEEAPSMELPPEIPPELIPAYLVKEDPPAEPEPEPEPEPELVLAPPPPPPSPPPRLASPQNMRPARGARINYAQLQSQRSVSFSWSPVQGANSYVFVLYQMTSSGRRQVVRTTTSNTGYTLNDLKLLDRGDFIWQIEAVNIQRGVTERRGTVTENLFAIDFPVPGPVKIDDTGILYGN